MEAEYISLEKGACDNKLILQLLGRVIQSKDEERLTGIMVTTWGHSISNFPNLMPRNDPACTHGKNVLELLIFSLVMSPLFALFSNEISGNKSHGKLINGCKAAKAPYRRQRFGMHSMEKIATITKLAITIGSMPLRTIL